MDAESQNEPLMAGPPVNIASAQRSGSSRAYKVAGVTLLACILIAGQAMVAYFLLSQKAELRSLEEQSDSLKSEITRGRISGGAAMPSRTQMSINAFPEMADVLVDKDGSRKAGKTVSPPTECQMEAWGLKPINGPGFRPRCDPSGLYWPQQCFQGDCWCVNPATGEQIPGSMYTSDPAGCGAGSARAFATGMRSQVLAVPETSD
ncbi:H-2 class II histocompatibility antigen gamma chain-like [Nelusetta ayraudi]|uniref:H-2 class II histocompatibility antigen gamma chain-like n=1 Tax=Nelusetta ayraudi TaxID=303726 RepID=UPI003F6F7F3F